MIIVFPDAFTKYDGAMYSNSPTTGDWETFITKDLVNYIDSHYRSIPTRESRGLAGHSMGGYGAWRIGMKHPEVYTAIYPMSCVSTMHHRPSRCWRCVNVRLAASDRRSPQPRRTAKMARSRSPFSVVMSGAFRSV